uniref:Uncharacterized protein n=1 Tax=Rhizophora mucronata TaxID=61149 RepID=A0A2P2PDI7_RHIMU
MYSQTYQNGGWFYNWNFKNPMYVVPLPVKLL